MIGFLKKILGLPTEEEILAAKKQSVVVNNKTGDAVDLPRLLPVNPQITDAVTQVVPIKKVRKPRTPKVDRLVKEKAAKPVKEAAKKVAVKRLKKV